MKLILLSLLPAASAYTWFTNDGWSKPADFNSQACASNPNTRYFCGTLAGTRGENPYPNAFPRGRNTCTLADTLGRGCNWKGATGIVVCC
ncbi:hypothetical protein COCSADRAFT_37678 [Bipolaris sorokiniana ND90Pr]|uniref:Uncharacterized protein n=1 Tax=Cochliobolus sativus (strain ND90Pr / ATCC 201652) TaxID=665912 RepID=M2SNT1_COCSN|nr:uncharacterized protein COCSADRAFT_37678 [Bipolaris sorokiniana ND90Pr]EMD63960.1 hypothetical protein COCSADRAFT_37678 [Bipolaris sorokiniana ND90Pr]